MVLSGLLDCSACVDTVRLEIDDLGAADTAICAVVNDDAVEDAIGELIAFDVAEGAFAPDCGCRFRFGKKGADVGVGKAGVEGV